MGPLSRKHVLLATSLPLLIVLGVALPCAALDIQAENVAQMAVYGPGLNVARSLQPNQISYNISSPQTIRTILRGIEFGRERNCSELGSLLSGIVYIRFLNGDVVRYQLSNDWSNFSSYGVSGCCYQVSEQVQGIFRENAQ